MVMRRSSPASSTLASNPFLTAASRPYSKNAAAIASRVKSVRAFRRRRLARMNGRNRSIGHAPCAGDAGEVNAKRARDATAKGEYSLGPVNEGKLMSKHETHAESRAPA